MLLRAFVDQKPQTTTRVSIYNPMCTCDHFFTASPSLALSSSLTQCLAETVCSPALSSQQPSACLLRELMVRTARGNGETETGSRRRERTWRKGRERERRKCTAIENFLALYGVSFVPHAFSCPIHVEWDTSYKNTYYCYGLPVTGGSSHEGSEDGSSSYSAS